MRKTPIRLRLSGLTGTVYALTRYTEGNGWINAQEKYDVTADFEEVAADYMGWLAEQGNPKIDKGAGGQFLADGLEELVKRLNAKREGKR